MTEQEKIMAIRNGTAVKRRAYWSPEDNELLKKMFFEAVGISEMAVHFERSEDAVVKQLHNLELYKRVRAENKPKNGCKCPECSKYAECKEKGKLCEPVQGAD